MHGTKRGGRGGLRTLALLTGLTALLIAPASASAAATWLPSKTVSNTANEAGHVDAAMDRNGNTLVTWFENIGGENRTRAAYRPAGGNFQAAQTLSTAGASAQQPHPAFDATGKAVVVWLRANVVQFATRSAGAGGSFSAPQDVSNSAVAASVPQLAVADDGTAFMTYIAGGTAQVVIRHPDGQRDAPVTLSATGVQSAYPYTGVQVAVNGRGDAALAWDRLNSSYQVEATYRPAGRTSTFSPAQQITSVNSNFFPQPGVDPQGRATIVWESCPSSCQQIQSSSRQAGTGQLYSAPDPVSSTGTTYYPEADVDSEGSALAIWINNEGAGYRVQTAFRPVNSSFQGVQNVGTATGNTFAATVGFDPADNALALFVRETPSGISVQAARRPKNGGFGGVDILSGTGVNNGEIDPGLGFDAKGNAIAVWQRFNGTRTVAEFAAYDAAGPSLSVNAPSAATVGQGLGFSASTSDVWSAVTTKWDFGDGTPTATGNSVQHKYTRAGTFQVGVTATDAAGNATTTSRSIQISSPPVVIPPPVVTPPGGGGGGPLTVVPSTTSINSLAFPKFTKIVNLSAKNLQAGSTVLVTCKAKKKKQQKKSCPYKRKRFTTSGARASLNLRKPFKKKKVRVGTKITITITAPGFLGKKVTYTIRARKLPKSRVQCLSASGKAGSCA
jgi:hypothetical protein